MKDGEDQDKRKLQIWAEIKMEAADSITDPSEHLFSWFDDWSKAIGHSWICLHGKYAELSVGFSLFAFLPRQ